MGKRGMGKLPQTTMEMYSHIGGSLHGSVWGFLVTPKIKFPYTGEDPVWCEVVRVGTQNSSILWVSRIKTLFMRGTKKTKNDRRHIQY